MQRANIDCVILEQAQKIADIGRFGAEKPRFTGTVCWRRLSDLASQVHGTLQRPEAQRAFDLWRTVPLPSQLDLPPRWEAALTVDYRLAILAGESSGAALAISLAITLRDQKSARPRLFYAVSPNRLVDAGPLVLSWMARP